MPSITPNTKVRSPYIEYSGPVIPNYTFSNAKYERIGSADTMVGRLMGNFYDRSLIPEASQNNQRYYNQGGWTTSANNIGRLASAVPGGILSLANTAFTLSPVGSIYMAATDKDFLTAMDTNPIAELYKGYKGMMNASLPTFVRDDFSTLSFFQQFSRPGEMLTENNESLQFLVEMFASSGALASAKIGPKLANYLATNKPLFKSLTSLQGPNIAKTANRIDMGLTNAALSVSEAYQEGMDSYKQSIENLSYNRMAGINNLTDEEMTSAAKKARNNVFLENLATLAFTNGSFLSLVKPMFKPLEASSRSNKYAISFKEGKYTRPAYASEGASKFDKFLYDKGYTTGVVTRSLLENVVSEGLEESLQYSIQKVNKLTDDLSTDTSKAGSFLNYLKTLPEVADFSDPERLKAAGLGALIGGGQVAISSGMGYGPAKEARDYRKERDEHINSLNDAYTNFVEANIYKKDKDKTGKLFVRTTEEGEEYVNQIDGTENVISQIDYESLSEKYGVDPKKGGEYLVKGQFQFDETGQPIKDPVKVAQYIKDVATQGELDDFIEQESMKKDPDPLKLTLYKREKLAALAEQAFRSGSTELLIERLNTLKESSPEELIEMGIDPKDAETMPEELSNQILELEKLWHTVSNSVVNASYSKEDNALNDSRRSYLYRNGSRMLTLDQLIRDHNKQYESDLTTLSTEYKEEDQQDVSAMVNAMAEKHRIEEALGDLFATKNSLESYLLYTDLEQDMSRQHHKEDAVAKLDDINTNIEKEFLKRDKLTTKFEEIPIFNKLANDAKIEKLAQLQNNIRQLSDARESLGKDFDATLNARTGLSHFKSKKDSTNNIASIYDKGLDKIRITPDTTTKSYDFYEGRASSKKHFKEKVERTSTEFYSELVDQFLTWYNSNLDNTSKEDYATLGRNFTQLLAEIIDKVPRLYQDTYTKVSNHYDELIQFIRKNTEPLVTEAKNEGFPEDIIDFYIDEKMATLEEGPGRDAFIEDVKRYHQAKELKEAMGNFYTNSLDVKEKLASMVGDPKELSTEKELRVQVAEDFLAPSLYIFEASGFTGEAIDESYTDDISPTFEIQKLEKLIVIWTEKGKDYSDVITRAKETITGLKELLKLVEANKANREIRNKKENAVYSNSFLSTVGLGNVVDPANVFYVHLVGTIGQEKVDAIHELSNTSPDLAVKIVMDALQTAEVSTTIKEQQGIVRQLIQEEISNSFPDSNISEDVYDSFVSSPLRVFKTLLASIIHGDIVTNGFRDRSLEEFQKDYDIVKLLESRNPTSPTFVDRDGTSLKNADIDNIMGMYLEMISLSKLLFHVNSEVSELDKLNTLLKYATTESASAEGKPTPTVAQERVISELSSWIKAPATPTSYVGQNVATLKAPPGAGKSLVVTPLIMEVVGLEAEEIVCGATFAPAAANIATALSKSETNTIETLIEMLESNAVPTTAKLMIVDEVGPANFLKIDALLKSFAKFNRENTTRVPLKMLLIYDPNQVTAGYKTIPDIEEIGYRLPEDPRDTAHVISMAEGNYELTTTSNLVFTQNFYDATPLSTSYRSDVSQIVDLFTKFATSKTVVVDVKAATSIDPKVDTTNILGTYVESDNRSLIPILSRSVLQNPDRTKALICGSTETVEKYKADLLAVGIPLDKVTITTVEHAQGLTFDEVYVDVRTTDSPTDYPNLFNYPQSYNKYVNTAISRASKFAYVANVIGSNTTDPTIVDKTAIAASMKKTDYPSYIDNKKVEIAAIEKMLNDVTVDTTTTETVEEVEATEEAPVTETSVEELEIIDSEEDFESPSEVETFVAEPIPIPQASPNEGTHTLLHPENYAFSNLLEFPAVQRGDEVIFVKDSYNPKIFDTYKERILVLKALGNNQYRRIAVLSDSEVPAVQTELNVDFTRLRSAPFNPTSVKGILSTEGELYNDQFIPAFLSADSTGLTYHYDDGEPTSSMNDAAHIRAVFDRWASTLLGPTYKSKIENYDAIVTNPEQHFYIRRFSSPSRITKFFAGRKAPNVPPKIGVPYLFIEGVKLVGDTDVLAPQYIRGTSNILTISTPLAQVKNHKGENKLITIAVVRRFNDLVKNFENELASTPTLGIYSRVKMGVPAVDATGKEIKDSNGNSFYAFHSLIKAFSGLTGESPIKIFGTNKDGIDTQGIADAIKKQFPDIDPKNVSKKLIELASKIDSLQHFGDEYMVEKGLVPLGQRRSFQGHAQIAMNKLATENFFLSIPVEGGSSSMILRDYETNRIGTKTTETVVAKRLLGPITIARKNRAYNPLVKNGVLLKLTKYVKGLELRGKTESLRYKQAKDILSKSGEYDVQTPHLTQKSLESLVVGGANAKGVYTNISEGFGLRAPISIYTEDSPLVNVGTTFKGVTPTSVSVTRVKVDVPEEEKTPKQKPNIKVYIQNNVYTTLEELVEVIESLYTPEEREEFITQMKSGSLVGAVLSYIKVAESTENLAKLSISLGKTVKNLMAVLSSYDTDVEVLKTLYDDSNYWKEDSKTKFGPRDNVRLAVLLHIAPELADSPKLINKAVYFAQNKWFRSKEISEYLDGLDENIIIDKLQGLVDAATSIAKTYSIDVTPPTVVTDKGINIEEIVYYISEEVGSQVRHKQKVAAPLPNPSDDNWKTKLATLVYNEATTKSIQQHIETNKDLAKSLGINVEGDATEEAANAVLTHNLLPERDMVYTDVTDDIGRHLTDTEALGVYESLLPTSTLKGLKKIKHGESFRILSFNQMQYEMGKSNWGLYKNGILYITRHMQTGKIGEKVIRHEVLHKIIWEYLTPLDRAKLFTLARAQYGDLPSLELEERIVEAFANRQYENPNTLWNSIVDVFRKLLRFLGFTYNNLRSLDTFFSSVDSGYYKAKSTKAPKIERDMKIGKLWKVTDATLSQDHPDFGSLESYTVFEELLFETFDKIYSKPRVENTGKLLSFEEAIDETFKYLKEIHTDPTKLGTVDARVIRAALDPIIDTNGLGRKAVLKEFFPNSRKAELLAAEIAALKENYESLYELSEELGFDAEEETSRTLQEALENVEKELGIKEELFESELRNPKDKLTGRVKHRFSTIQYLDKGTIKSAEFSKVFNVLLDVIPQVTNIGTVNFIEEVMSRLNTQYRPKDNASYQRSIGAATTKFLRDTFINYKNFSERSSGNITFSKDANNLLEYVIVHPAASSLTRTEAKKIGATIIDRNDGESLHSFADRVSSISPVTYQDVRNAYYLYEEVSFINSLVSAIASLRTNNPHVGITYYHYGDKVERYFANRRSGSYYVLESDLNAFFNDYVSSRRNTSEELLSEAYKENLPLPSSTDAVAKLEAVNTFLTTIGLNKSNKIRSLGDTQTEGDDFYFRFYHFIQDISEEYKKPATQEDIAQYGPSTFRYGAAILSDQGTVRGMLAERLNYTSSATSPTSYKRGDGKSAYRKIDASYQSMTLNYLVEAFKRHVKGSKPLNTQIPSHLTFVKTGNGYTIETPSKLYTGNVFTTGKNRIREMIDHDSMKTHLREKWARYLRRETTSDYHRRNFSFGFLNQFKNSKGASYIQFLPIPANRSAIQGALIDYLNPKASEEAVKAILRSQITRPNPKEAGLDNNEQYVKNWGNIYFPGVYDEAGVSLKVKDLGPNVDAAVDRAYTLYNEHIKRSVENIVNDFKNDFQGKKIEVDENSLIFAASKMGMDTSKYVYMSDIRKARKQSKKGKLPLEDLSRMEENREAIYYKALSTVLDNFYRNFVVNQYSLSQLLYGDQTFFKGKEDLTKRVQVATATGDIGMVDPTNGLPKYSNIAVIQDINLEVPTDLDQVRDDSFGDTYDAADAQGYVLPEFYEKMSKAYSVDSKLDVTLKPVYYAIQPNGSPLAVKYSLIVLSDEFCKANPIFETVRQQMRDNSSGPIDQIVFNSSVKVGNPLKKNLTSFAETAKQGVNHNGKAGFNPDSILRMDNSYLKIQLNPAKDTDGSNANPSQATAFMNTNGLNTQEISKLHTLNSLILDTGMKKLSRELELSSKGGLTKNSLNAVRKRLISMTDDLPGADDVNILLSHKENGKYAISMNVPLLAKRVTSALSSLISRSTVSFRFPGSKFVLQAQAGISEHLQWKDKDGYTEVILPETYKRYFSEGQVITNGLVAFRIPSTNYHSLLALKIKGFYPVPPGSKGNVIIAPSLIVYYHGSDYDIDTLFVIRKREHEGLGVDLNKIIRKYDTSHTHTEALNYKDGDVYGMKDKTEVPFYLEQKLEIIAEAMETDRKKLSSFSKDDTARGVLLEALKEMEEDYYLISEHIIYAAQNSIVDLFSTNLRDEKNRRDLLTPITFTRASNNKAELIEELDTDIETYLMLLKKDNVIDKIQYCE